MKNFVVTLIGGGSLTWTPKFTRDILLMDSIEGLELRLMDIDEKKLELMFALTQKMSFESGKRLRIKAYTNRKDSLENVDIVVSTCLIGGHDTWRRDLDIIRSYGIHHPKGMSVGPGGFIQGLKNITGLLDIAADMEVICPDAWLLVYTNPVQTITLALQKYSKIKAIGLCHGVTEGIENLAKFLGVSEKDLAYRAFGINHCGWLFDLRKNNVSIMKELKPMLEEHAPRMKGRWEGEEIITRQMLDIFGAFPLQADIHTIEFFPHFIAKDKDLSDFSLNTNYVQQRIENMSKLEETAKRAIAGEIQTSDAIGTTAKGDDLKDTSTEKIDVLIKGIIYNEPANLYINTMNNGCISNLPADCCVETPAVVDSYGYRGCNMGEVPDGIAALMTLQAYIQKLTVESAVKGSRELAMQALFLDPMCNSLSPEEIRSMLNELIEFQPEWLPTFNKAG
ncbi:MAG: hypothetical protein FWH55_08030 [Oscillospiraceae bacterium]|nr:hypothetical protein [Oscillospiraceae bacterium]